MIYLVLISVIVLFLSCINGLNGAFLFKALLDFIRPSSENDKLHFLNNLNKRSLLNSSRILSGNFYQEIRGGLFIVFNNLRGNTFKNNIEKQIETGVSNSFEQQKFELVTNIQGFLPLSLII